MVRRAIVPALLVVALLAAAVLRSRDATLVRAAEIAGSVAVLLRLARPLRLRLRAKFRRAPVLALEVAAIPLVALSLIAGAAIGDPVVLAAPLVREDRARPVDAVVVFSGDVDFHRTVYGARVFRELGARWFVVTGAGSGGDSGSRMADAALAAGIPREALVVETRARSTRENATLTRPLLEAHGVRVAAVVTSRFHSRRASMVAEHAWRGVDVVSRPVPESDPHECSVRAWRSVPECRASLQSEWEKLLGYLLLGWA